MGLGVGASAYWNNREENVTTVEDIRSALRARYPDVDDNQFSMEHSGFPHEHPLTAIGVVLISSVLLGTTDVDRLAEFTRYSKQFVRAISSNMDNSRLWKDGKYYCDAWSCNSLMPCDEKQDQEFWENHLLRLIDRHIDFEFIRAKLKDCYCYAGRPSIDPELLLRMLLVGYLYGVTSERKLVEELRMHLAWRWFTGQGFDEEIPHHSTFSKNRHGRFQESNLFQELFEEIVSRCVAAGLVKGEHMSVDGSFIQANADHHSRVPRDHWRKWRR
jgi:transposase